MASINSNLCDALSSIVVIIMESLSDFLESSGFFFVGDRCCVEVMDAEGESLLLRFPVVEFALVGEGLDRSCCGCCCGGASITELFSVADADAVVAVVAVRFELLAASWTARGAGEGEFAAPIAVVVGCSWLQLMIVRYSVQRWEQTTRESPWEGG